MKRLVPTLVVIAALTASLSACGSTVSGASLGAGSGQLADGSGLGIGATGGGTTTGATGALPGDGSASTVPGDQPSAVPTADSTSPTDLGGGGGGGPTTINGHPASGHGYTATTINLGYGTTSDNTASSVAAFGISGVGDPGDIKPQLQAVVNDAMKHGGFAGRTINLIPHAYNTTQEISDPSTAGQAACADMTQDHKVVAFLAPGLTNDSDKACFGKAQTPMLVGAGLESVPTFRPGYRQYPLYYNIGGMLGDRYFTTAMNRLYSRGFFDKWNVSTGDAGGTAPVKIGVLVQDNAAGAQILATYTAALARFGLKISMVEKLPTDVPRAVAAGQSAVLQFRSAGITHVLGITLPFANTAQQQAYHPRYFINCCIAVVGASVTQSQLHGSMTEGYIPAWETDAAHSGGNPTSATTHCLAVMAAAGMKPTNQTMLLQMEGVCDLVYSFQAALIANGGDLSAAGLIRGFESLGSKIQLSDTWTTTFEPGEHSTARAVRDMAFDGGCRCFYYTSKTNQPAN